MARVDTIPTAKEAVPDVFTIVNAVCIINVPLSVWTVPAWLRMDQRSSVVEVPRRELPRVKSTRSDAIDSHFIGSRVVANPSYRSASDEFRQRRKDHAEVQHPDALNGAEVFPLKYVCE